MRSNDIQRKKSLSYYLPLIPWGVINWWKRLHYYLALEFISKSLWPERSWAIVVGFFVCVCVCVCVCWWWWFWVYLWLLFVLFLVFCCFGAIWGFVCCYWCCGVGGSQNHPRSDPFLRKYVATRTFSERRGKKDRDYTWTARRVSWKALSQRTEIIPEQLESARKLCPIGQIIPEQLVESAGKLCPIGQRLYPNTRRVSRKALTHRTEIIPEHSSSQPESFVP